jgi:hypothetical protein
LIGSQALQSAFRRDYPGCRAGDRGGSEFQVHGFCRAPERIGLARLRPRRGSSVHDAALTGQSSNGRRNLLTDVIPAEIRGVLDRGRWLLFPGLSVAECSLNLANTTAVTTSTRLLLTAPLTFSTLLTGSKYVFLAALNAANVPSASYAFASYGTWNVCSATCPAENLLSTQHAVNLGTVGLGATSSVSIVISNPNATTATLGKITTSNAAFTQTNTCPVALAPNVHCTVDITFTPLASGVVSATLTIPHGLAAGSLTVSLRGTGTPATLAASPNPLNFGYSIVGQSMSQAITVSNYTRAAIDITGVDLAGASFTVQDKCTGQALAPGASCLLVVTGVPSTAGSLTGNVDIISSQGSVSVPLAIVGVQP